MYYHQSIIAPYKSKFQEEMMEEFHNHCDLKYWSTVTLDNLNIDTKVMDTVWSMKIKEIY